MQNLGQIEIIAGGIIIALVLLVFGIIAKTLFSSGSRRNRSAFPIANSKENEGEFLELHEKASWFEALADERSSLIAQLNEDLSKLRAKLGEDAKEKEQKAAKIAELHAKMAAEDKASGEKIEILTKLREDMEMKFKALASEALKVQGEAFSKTNLEKLEATLSPLKEHVGHFEKELKGVHETALKDREHLKTVISELGKRSQLLSEETLALTRALKSDQQKQGAWGEMILENILQSSGLRAGEEYETQAKRSGADGERLRPDVIVYLPDGKTIVIDSKVSLVAYQEAVNAEDDEVRTLARKRHVAALKRQINDLAAKAYQRAEVSSVDFVIMFLAIEGALSEALHEERTLTEYALEKQVAIATPTTLMMALKTIAQVWAVERRNQNAEEIAKRAGRLYDKVAGFVKNMEEVGKSLDKAQEVHQKAFNQLSKGRGNMLSHVEGLKILGAKTDKSLAVGFDGEEANEAILKGDDLQIGVTPDESEDESEKGDDFQIVVTPDESEDERG